MALPHVPPGQVVHLGPIDSADSQGSKTRALVKTDRFEAAQLVILRGTTISPHSVSGPITLYCIEGKVNLQATRTVQMDAGDWLHLEGGEEHALEALADSSLLLTIFFN